MQDAGQFLKTMRATAPLVQNITNYVAMNVMANVMLASGASPAMVHAREEAAEFAAIASALTVNIGTLDPDWLASMEEAAKVMNADGKPWVFDPVAVFATALRRDAGARLLALKPSVIRGNASEILALGGGQSAGQGVDTGDSVTSSEDAANSLARQTGGIVAVTGPQDYITDGHRAYCVENGHEMMPFITALGCSLTGIVSAFVVDQDPLEATVAALAYFGLAGEVSAAQVDGPASLSVGLIDALYRMTPEDLSKGARISEI